MDGMGLIRICKVKERREKIDKVKERKDNVRDRRRKSK